MAKKIILSAGGTGGHLFPAIALGEELSKIPGYSVHLVTDLRCKKYLPADLGFEAHIIDIYLKFSAKAGKKSKVSNIYNKVRSIFYLIKAGIKSFFLTSRLKPDIVIGFGGYPSLPMLLWARIFRIPVIIHEQNCFLGKVNRLFADYAKLIALSYPETVNIDKYDKKKIIITGDLVRESIKNLPNNYNPNNEFFTIFIVGGSQGARFFSTLVPEAIEKLLTLKPDTKIKIIQQSSLEDQENLRNRYSKLGLECELSDFFRNITNIYAKSMLVISRSGAGTIAELKYVGVPAIFIPYPHSSEDHQYFNAKAIENSGGGRCFREENITPKILAEELFTFITNPELLLKASQNLLKLREIGAVRNLSDTVTKIIN